MGPCVRRSVIKINAKYAIRITDVPHVKKDTMEHSVIYPVTQAVMAGCVTRWLDPVDASLTTMEKAVSIPVQITVKVGVTKMDNVTAVMLDIMVKHVSMYVLVQRTAVKGTLEIVMNVM
jgi:hypothetical protein